MLKYTAKLTHNAFDNTYANARLFNTKAERDTYFNNLAGYTYGEKINFNARDILTTEIVLKVEPDAPLFDLLNYNYCVITQVDENDQEVAKLYFWVKKSLQESAGQIRIYLENDILQNYWYDLTFSDCMIMKQHINRFEEDPNDNTKVIFKGDKDSDLFEREDIKDVSKRLVERQRLKFIIDKNSTTTLNDWLYNNVLCWVYIYISENGPETEGGISGLYNTVNQFGTAKQSISKCKVTDQNIQKYTYPYKILAYPILKNDDSFLQFKTYDTGVVDMPSYTWDIGQAGLEGFTSRNSGYSYIYNIKLSIKPPFKPSTLYNSTFVDIQGNMLTITVDRQGSNSTLNLGAKGFFYDEDYKSDGLLEIKNDFEEPLTLILNDNSIMPKLKFAKTDIINVNKNEKFNPKLNNMDYKELNLSFVGNSVKYDIQKINTENPSFIYTEMLGIDTTKGICKFNSQDNNNIFNVNYSKSYNGLTFTNDLSLPISNNQLNAYLANNKNAYLSFQNQQEQARSQATIGALGGALQGAALYALSGGTDFGGLMSGATGGVVNILQTLDKQYYEKAQFDMSIDNMRSAPAQMQNSNGNAIFSNTISPLGIYVELYEAIPNELKIANDLSYKNGYVYNRFGNIKDFVHTRKYFNYIEAIPTNINGNLSNVVKSNIGQILARGVRFWHTDTIQFEKENYELWLEE